MEIVASQRADALARFIGSVVVADAVVIRAPACVAMPLGVSVLPVNGPLTNADPATVEELLCFLVQP